MFSDVFNFAEFTIRGYDFGPVEVTEIPSKCNEMPFNNNSTRQDIE